MTNRTPDPGAEPEWAAFVAIDWGDRKNFWKLAVAGCEQRELGEVASTPEAVDAWASGLALRFGGRPIAVILEQVARAVAVHAGQVTRTWRRFPCTRRPPRAIA